MIWLPTFPLHKPQGMFPSTEGREVYSRDDGGENWRHLSTILSPLGPRAPRTKRP
jgi:hypothetical protein